MDAHWKQSEFIIFPQNILLLENNNRNHFYNILCAPSNYFWLIPLVNKIYQYSWGRGDTLRKKRVPLLNKLMLTSAFNWGILDSTPAYRLCLLKASQETMPII